MRASLVSSKQSKFIKRATATLLLAAYSFSVGCGGGGGGNNPVAPSPPSPSPPAQTTIRLAFWLPSEGCITYGGAYDVRVWVNDAQLGGFLQMNGEVSTQLAPGTHSYRAQGVRSDGATLTWERSTITVTAGTGIVSFNCASAQVSGDGWIEVLVHSNCTGRVINVRVSIDGQFVGELQPGIGSVRRTVSIGYHTVSATSQRAPGSQGINARWDSYEVRVPAEGNRQTLTCEGL